MSLKETVDKVKSVGIDKARITPVEDGKFVLEIEEEDHKWTKLTKPMSKGMTEDILRQATNKVILG